MRPGSPTKLERSLKLAVGLKAYGGCFDVTSHESVAPEHRQQRWETIRLDKWQFVPTPSFQELTRKLREGSLPAEATRDVQHCSVRSKSARVTLFLLFFVVDGQALQLTKP